ELTDDDIEQMQAGLPKLPHEYRIELRELGVDASVVNTILAQQLYAELDSRVQQKNVTAARRVANWIASSLSTDDTHDVHSLADVDDLIELATMAEGSEVSSNAASELFNDLMAGAKSPRTIAIE